MQESKNPNNCQIPCLPALSVGRESEGLPPSFKNHIKRAFAKPWNYYGRKMLKKYLSFLNGGAAKIISKSATYGLKPGDTVRVRSAKEIEATLDSLKELKGCAFMECMWQYCGTTHRVLQTVERFLDERDYEIKKCRGIVILDGVICRGTPVFGRCDRCCHLFWREEWLERINESLQ